MKTIDVIAAALLVVGGLNWGLVGAANFNLVSAIFGTNILANLVYVLVGLSAVYEVFSVRSMQRRWATA
ncbi:MAG TPA: DUF378 domain-containing protein [Thermoanaerobaculia bacterium]|nr:DUF378 domain-containing protein [Thermoanaerobaculia bacterium]